VSVSPLTVAVVSSVVGGWLLLPARAPASSASRPIDRWLATAVVAAVALLVVPAGWLVPVGLIVCAGVASRALWLRRASARRAEQRSARLAEVCDLLAAELAAGRPPDVALDEAATAWPDMRSVADTCRLGGDVPTALRVLAQQPGADGLRLLAAAWQVSQQLGAGLAASTQRVADAGRRDQATRRVVAGELASARATARLVAVLPVVALLMGSGAGGDPWFFLFRTPAGWGCLAAGLALGFGGLWWIEALAREVDR
jgi:tight adherence protein B